MKTYRLVLLGSGGVGKTSLVCQFCHKFFSQTYQPTVEDNYGHLVQLPDGGFHHIEILDTAGFYQFPAQLELNIRTGHAFVVVYSIDKQDSFDHATRELDKVLAIKGEDKPPLILVGNKQDLEDFREVSRDVGEQAARDRGLAFMETSAMGRLNVDEVFMKLVLQAFEPATPEEDTPVLTRRWSGRSFKDRLRGVQLRQKSLEEGQTRDKENRRPSGKLSAILRRNSDGENNNEDSRCTIL